MNINESDYTLTVAIPPIVTISSNIIVNEYTLPTKFEFDFTNIPDKCHTSVLAYLIEKYHPMESYRSVGILSKVNKFIKSIL